MAPVKDLKSEDAIKTYRYLRIGMIGAVALLAAAIIIEYLKTEPHCFQTSISAYYYTPVRAIFVGFLIALGLSLIVYKGRSPWEDFFLNFAGMLAPVVAVAPTLDFGKCWSVPPSPLPRQQPDGPIAEWVVTNIQNNFTALLIAGVIGLVVSLLITVFVDPNAVVERETRPTTVPLGLTGIILIVGYFLSRSWDDFNELAHGYAAVLLITLLTLAVISKAVDHWDKQKYREEQKKHSKIRAALLALKRQDRWFRTYAIVAFLMAVGPFVIWPLRIGGEHVVAILEAYEILLFGLYWIAQTREYWWEEVEPGPSVRAAEPDLDAPQPIGG